VSSAMKRLREICAEEWQMHSGRSLVRFQLKTCGFRFAAIVRFSTGCSPSDLASRSIHAACAPMLGSRLHSATHSARRVKRQKIQMREIGCVETKSVFPQRAKPSRASNPMLRSSNELGSGVFTS